MGWVILTQVLPKKLLTHILDVYLGKMLIYMFKCISGTFLVSGKYFQKTRAKTDSVIVLMSK